MKARAFWRASGGGTFDTDQVALGIGETAMTLDMALRYDSEVCGVAVRPGINFKYISDMPFIDHPMTEVSPTIPVSLDSRASYFLGVNVEVFVLLRCRGLLPIAKKMNTPRQRPSPGCVVRKNCGILERQI